MTFNSGNTTPFEVMIFGSGQCARKIAANLSGHGIHAWLATSELDPQISQHENANHWLSGTRLSAVKGFPGNFRITLERDNAFLRKQVAAIVLAQDTQSSPNYAPYGLSPGPRIIDISALEDGLSRPASDPLFGQGANIAFLCSWNNESHADVCRRMLNGCLQVQRRLKANTIFMAGNLKVASDGAEALYQEAKKAGALFVKFTHSFPALRPQDGGGFLVEYQDELTRSAFQITADWIVVDESIIPGRDLDCLAGKLDIEKDHSGFAQCDNVHRLSNATNRRGIFVAGGSRGILSVVEQSADADQVTLKLLQFRDDVDREPLPKVEIQRGRCALCLTCLRLCPHRAIDLEGRVRVVSEACQSCGICVSGCPARAIDMEGHHIRPEIDAWGQAADEKPQTPDSSAMVMVLGCSRSAGQARQLAIQAGRTMPEEVRFIEIPCGGAVSHRHLLAAFEAGADGVMLCTCHAGNCRAEIGNILAGKRAQMALEILEAAGVERHRLKVTSVAANMGNEFYFEVKAFAGRIKTT